MKRFKIYFPFLMLLTTFSFFQASATDIGKPLELPSKEVVAQMTKEQKEELVISMKTRVDEIKAMDRSTLTKEDRKALKAELKNMRREERHVTGVYISIGALIIIILLLIIIL